MGLSRSLLLVGGRSDGIIDKTNKGTYRNRMAERYFFTKVGANGGGAALSTKSRCVCQCLTAKAPNRHFWTGLLQISRQHHVLHCGNKPAPNLAWASAVTAESRSWTASLPGTTKSNPWAAMAAAALPVGQYIPTFRPAA